ncbi:MAG TPA: DUF91 domain-containing protein [Myxococcales bacterium]|nr:DUF91 domain-containing protein [Myxococcales bacterium]
MKRYNRVMAGQKSLHAALCFREGFIGIDYGFDVDFTGRLSEHWKDFNREFRPVYLDTHPHKSKMAAGLACGMTWRVCKALFEGDVILTPDGSGRYRVGELTGPYYHVADGPLPHRRPVRWLPQFIDRADMSQALQYSTGAIGTCADISKYSEELECLIDGQPRPTLISTDETVEDPSVFALEKHLEAFLVANWAATDLGRQYDIYEEDGELMGQQFQSDTGPIDILAISKDKKELLIIELKKNRANDAVVGQIQRYMGYVMEELAEDDQTVKGVIIAHEDSLRIRRALKVTRNISFYCYQVSFALVEVAQ